MKRERYFWLLQVLGWGCISLFTIFVDRMEWKYMPLSVFFGLSGIMLSTLWRYVCKLRLQRGKPLAWPVAIGAAFVLGLIQCAINAWVNMLVAGPDWKPRGVAWVLSIVSYWSGAMLAWNVCYMAALSIRRNQRLEAEALLLEAETLRLEVLAKDAELRALQSQVNPHFFFNSLNSVRALMYVDVDNAANMIDRLATLMRYTLMSTFNDCVPLQHELDAVRSYLAIEQIRFEERLRMHIEVAPGLEQVTIPPMALQTLVENAVKYGVERRTEGSEIRIVARRLDGCAMIEVANQGRLLTQSGSTRVGVSNARKRLVLAKGAQASLDLSEQDGWVRAILRFPLAA